jgi:Protein of unknown function (DUF3179)
MRDEETGSYWQQVTGAAIAGTLKGAQLTLISQDELTFALWKKEHPDGTVLAPLQQYAAKYEKATWESEIAKLPTVIHGTKGSLPDRETIIGVTRVDAAKAYPLARLTDQSPVLLDNVGGQPIMLVLGPDGKAVHVFSRQIGGRTLEFYGHSAANPSESWALVDDTTLGGWTFDGCAISGELQGQCLTRIDALKDYWFDWQHYHPHSEIFRH